MYRSFEEIHAIDHNIVCKPYRAENTGASCTRYSKGSEHNPTYVLDLQRRNSSVIEREPSELEVVVSSPLSLNKQTSENVGFAS